MSHESSFNDLVSAINEEFLSANDIIEEQHLRKIANFFNDDGTAKTVDIQVPYF